MSENNAANFETDFCDCQLARIPAMLKYLAHNSNTVGTTIQRKIRASIIQAYAQLGRGQAQVEPSEGEDLHFGNGNDDGIYAAYVYAD